MGVILAVIGLLMATAAVVTVVGMVIGDIKAIRLESDLKKHPHALKFRKKPLVSVVVHDTSSDECIASIEHSDYRKTEVIFSGEESHGDLLLYLKRDTTLEPHAISNAVRQFNSDHKLDAIELIPVLTTPDTIRKLFTMYHDIALAPFIPARAAFHAVPHWSRWPVMVRRSSESFTIRLYLSRILRWLVLSANAVVLFYVSYIAVVLYEPFFIMIYMWGFCVWMVLAISSRSGLTLVQKIYYTLLTPVTFVYFLFLAFRAPFNPALIRLRGVISRTSWRSFGQPMA